jgi:hypothetical protein
MPEIYELFFGLGELLKLFPRQDREFAQKLEEFEEQAQEDMAYNRLKLFGLESEFEKI